MKYDSERELFYLMIKDALESDSGTYRCTARNSAGEEWIEITVTVTIIEIIPR